MRVTHAVGMAKSLCVDKEQRESPSPSLGRNMTTRSIRSRDYAIVCKREYCSPGEEAKPTLRWHPTVRDFDIAIMGEECVFSFSAGSDYAFFFFFFRKRFIW
jgi:hypothetical protein